MVDDAEIMWHLSKEISKHKNTKYKTFKEGIGRNIHSTIVNLSDGEECTVTIQPFWDIYEVEAYQREGAIAVIANIKGEGLPVGSRASKRFVILPDGKIYE